MEPHPPGQRALDGQSQGQAHNLACSRQRRGSPSGTMPSTTSCSPTGLGTEASPLLCRCSKTPCGTPQSQAVAQNTGGAGRDGVQNKNSHSMTCLVGCEEVIGPTVVLGVYSLHTVWESQVNGSYSQRRTVSSQWSDPCRKASPGQGLSQRCTLDTSAC